MNTEKLTEYFDGQVAVNCEKVKNLILGYLDSAVEQLEEMVEPDGREEATELLIDEICLALKRTLGTLAETERAD